VGHHLFFCFGEEALVQGEGLNFLLAGRMVLDLRDFCL
jgi:hypothetical protein